MNSDDLLQQKISGAFLGLACGDALGAPMEFLSPHEARLRFGHLTEMVGGGMWEPGEWTDDTAMALGLAEGILENWDDPIPVAGKRFLAWQPGAKDVGATISSALNAFQGDWAAAALSTPQARAGKAAGNGTLMRVLPVALAYPDQDLMLVQSARQSAMTHWDPQAEMCCAIYCLWIRALLLGSSLREGWEWALAEGKMVESKGRLSADTPGPTPLTPEFWSRLGKVDQLAYTELQPSGYAGYALECLEAAAWCCLHGQNLEDVLVKAVNLAGEADTIAAVAGGIAGAFWGVNAIPSRWLEALWQAQHLTQVSQQLGLLRQHLLAYSRPGLPVFLPERVTSRLWAGRNPLTKWDLVQLKSKGLTHVLDLREAHEWSPPLLGQQAVAAAEELGLVRKNIPIVDVGAPTFQVLDACWEFLDQALSQPQAQVYVHCRAGIERTAAVLVAFEARRNSQEPWKTLQDLREGRPTLNPLRHQKNAVELWLNSGQAPQHR